jgi:hypothetical protein
MPDLDNQMDSSQTSKALWQFDIPWQELTRLKTANELITDALKNFGELDVDLNGYIEPKELHSGVSKDLPSPGLGKAAELLREVVSSNSGQFYNLTKQELRRLQSISSVDPASMQEFIGQKSILADSVAGALGGFTFGYLGWSVNAKVGIASTLFGAALGSLSCRTLQNAAIADNTSQFNHMRTWLRKEPRLDNLLNQ